MKQASYLYIHVFYVMQVSISAVVDSLTRSFIYIDNWNDRRIKSKITIPINRCYLHQVYVKYKYCAHFSLFFLLARKRKRIRNFLVCK